MHAIALYEGGGIEYFLGGVGGGGLHAVEELCDGITPLIARSFFYARSLPKEHTICDIARGAKARFTLRSIFGTVPRFWLPRTKTMVRVPILSVPYQKLSVV